MILTAESQERIIDNYMEEGHTLDETNSFIEGFFELF
jgi:hypothetical protein